MIYNCHYIFLFPKINEMSYRNLIDKDPITHSHKICGMNANVAIQVRNARKEKNLTALEPLRQKFESKIGDSQISFGFGVGSALKDDLIQTNWKEDVILYLISDPTNIDSKMITFVKNSLPMNVADKIFANLYKYDASA